MQRKHGSYERSINEIACGGTRELFVFLYISYRVSEKKMAMSVRLKPWRQFKDLFFRKSNLNIGDRGNFESPKTAYTSGPSLIGINVPSSKFIFQFDCIDVDNQHMSICIIRCNSFLLEPWWLTQKLASLFLSVAFSLEYKVFLKMMKEIQT